MMLSVSSLATGLLTLAPLVSAGFDPNGSKNIAVYWGQNSFGQGTGPLAQQRLSYYCTNTDIDIVPIAFMNGITPPITNFANAGDNCTKFDSNPNVLSCPEIEADVKSCQSAGKTMVISLAGATYSQGGWGSAADAQAAAQLVFDMFGPVNPSSSALRPFGSAVVDGFDFDFEASTNNIAAFGAALRSLIDRAAGTKKMYLTAAPQCVYPDAAVGPALSTVAFDFIMIQFYNNWCGTINFTPGTPTQNAFNFDVWDNWAKTVSKNPKVKVLLGIPANTGAGGGYTSGAQLNAAIQYSKQYSSFGGVMMWDASQLYANNGFLSEVNNALNSNPPPSTTLSTSVRPTQTGGGGGTVPQWGQCGGEGYTGPTECQAPYKCVYGGQWWSSCQ